MLQFVLEVIAQIVFELATAFGWESLKHSVRRERRASPLLAATGHLLMGVSAGFVSLLIFGRRLASPGPVPGFSLVLSPIGTGLVMHWAGEFWRGRGWDRPVLFSFRAGAIFALGMALVRFVYFQWVWAPS